MCLENMSTLSKDVCKHIMVKALGSSTDRAHLRAGDRVGLHSLQAKPQYNGKSGVLVAFNAESGRWEVDLDGGGSLDVKEANLNKADGALTGQSAASGSAEQRANQVLEDMRSKERDNAAKFVAMMEAHQAHMPKAGQDFECSWCRCLYASVRWCGRCKQVKYCGAQCQKQHWGKGHKAECAIWSASAN